MTTRSGYVALVGLPNAGKSTLLNALVGDKLSIVTPKAQTTWQRVTGILTTDEAQMIFLDTPGILSARDLLQRSMLGAALLALEEADLVLLVVDASNPPAGRAKAAISSALELSRVRRFAAINKIDAASDGQIQAVTDWVQDELGAEPILVSALKGTGLEHLATCLEDALPTGPFLYPADEIASEPVRFFVCKAALPTLVGDESSRGGVSRGLAPTHSLRCLRLRCVESATHDTGGAHLPGRPPPSPQGCCPALRLAPSMIRAPLGPRQKTSPPACAPQRSRPCGSHRLHTPFGHVLSCGWSCCSSSPSQPPSSPRG